MEIISSKAKEKYLKCLLVMLERFDPDSDSAVFTGNILSATSSWTCELTLNSNDFVLSLDLTKSWEQAVGSGGYVNELDDPDYYLGKIEEVENKAIRVKGLGGSLELAYITAVAGSVILQLRRIYESMENRAMCDKIDKEVGEVEKMFEI